MLIPRNLKRDPAILNTRIIGGRNSYEFKAWRHRSYSAQLSGVSLNSVLLVLIIVWLGLLGLRTLHMIQSGAVLDNGLPWLVMILSGGLVVVAIWRLVCNFRSIKELRSEIDRLSADIEHVAVS